MTDASRYTCEDTFRRLDDFMDRALTPEEVRLVEKHLETCAWCTSAYRFESTLIDGLRQKVSQIQLPPGFIERMTASLSRASRPDEEDESD